MSLIQSLFGNRRSNIFDPKSMHIWDPFFHGFPFNPTLSARDTSAFVNVRIDWRETPEAHVFKADLPGVKTDEIKVEVEEGNVLQISGEKKEEQEDKDDTWHLVERISGRFMRRFRLPENAKMEEVKAKMEEGVLTVTAPKMKEKKTNKKKSIRISSRI